MIAQVINFMKDWWGTPVIGTLITIVGGLYVPVFRVWLFKFFKTMLSASVLKYVFLSSLKALVESTKTTWDDELYEMIIKEVNKKSKVVKK